MVIFKIIFSNDGHQIDIVIVFFTDLVLIMEGLRHYFVHCARNFDDVQFLEFALGGVSVIEDHSDGSVLQQQQKYKSSKLNVH